MNCLYWFTCENSVKIYKINSNSDFRFILSFSTFKIPLKIILILHGQIEIFPRFSWTQYELLNSVQKLIAQMTPFTWYVIFFLLKIEYPMIRCRDTR